MRTTILSALLAPSIAVVSALVACGGGVPDDPPGPAGPNDRLDDRGEGRQTDDPPGPESGCACESLLPLCGIDLRCTECSGRIACLAECIDARGDCEAAAADCAVSCGFAEDGALVGSGGGEDDGSDGDDGFDGDGEGGGDGATGTGTGGGGTLCEQAIASCPEVNPDDVPYYEGDCLPEYACVAACVLDLGICDPNDPTLADCAQGCF